MKYLEKYKTDIVLTKSQIIQKKQWINIKNNENV